MKTNVLVFHTVTFGKRRKDVNNSDENETSRHIQKTKLRFRVIITKTNVSFQFTPMRFRAYLTFTGHRAHPTPPLHLPHCPTLSSKMTDMSSTITIVCIWGSLVITGICCATNCLGLFPDPRDPDDTQAMFWYWLRRIRRAQMNNNQVHVIVTLQRPPTRVRLVRSQPPPQPQPVFLPPSEPRTRFLEKLNSVLFRETHEPSASEPPASTADFVYSIEIRPLPPAVLSDLPGTVMDMDTDVEAQTQTQTPPEPPNEPRTCAICLTEEPTVGCYPCGHLCMCTECAVPMWSSRATCPMCRQAVTEVLQFGSRAPVGVELEARVMLVRAGGLARQDGRVGIPVNA